MAKPEPLIDLRPDHLAIVQDILREYLQGVEVWAYGSRAAWTDEEYSDLDLVARNHPDPLQPLDFTGIEDAREAFMLSNLPFRVELFDWARLPVKFHGEIEKGYVVVQGREKQAGGLPEGWREVALSEAISINPKIAITKSAQVPFVDMKQLEPGRREVFADEIREFNGSGSRFEHGDTLMARITPCLENGKIAKYYSDNNKPANGSTEFIVFRGTNGISDTDFAYYLVISPQVRQFAISKMTGTSGRQRVPVDALDKCIVALPPLPEQKAIAAILGALDDKIEANRKMNATLEGIARALFKSWFVDFDPVRRNMARQQPPLPNPPPQGGREHDVKPSPHEGGSSPHKPSPHEGGSSPHKPSPLVGGSSPHKPSPLVGEGWEGGHTRLHLTPAAKEHILQNARNLRKNLTDAEKLLWGCLRAHRLAGYSFRRQQPIGKYIVDFVCFEQKLIIEADGGQHADNPRDKERDAWLKSQGFHVLRFWNNDVLGNIEGVLLEILRVLEKPPLPTLPHKGGGLLGGDPSSTGEEGWHGDTLLPPPPLWGRAGEEGWHGDTLLPPPPLWGRAGEGGLEAYAALDALFPASFTDSPLGEIPAGWRVEKFGDFIERLPSGKKYDKKNTFFEGKVPVLDQGKSGIIGYHNQEPDIVASTESPLFTFANHTCYMRWVFTPSSAIQNVIPLMGKNVPIYFAYYATTGVQQFQEYKGHWPDFIRHHAIIPSSEIMDLFSIMVKPMVQKQFMLEQANQTLATLRDTLLPKLISGQIRVGDVGKLVEGVV